MKIMKVKLAFISMGHSIPSCANCFVRSFAFSCFLSLSLLRKMTDWGQNLALGSGITGSYRPFQARLRNALVQACQANRGQVKWKALTDWLAQRVDSEIVQADTGIGAIVSRSASFRYGFSNPWVCHCCCEVRVVASSQIDAAHLIPCYNLSSFLPK